MALWWLEEGSTNGFHFDQAALDFQVPPPSLAFTPFHLELQGLPSEVKERFLWRAILIMHHHPLVSCNNLIEGFVLIITYHRRRRGRGAAASDEKTPRSS